MNTKMMECHGGVVVIILDWHFRDLGSIPGYTHPILCTLLLFSIYLTYIVLENSLAQNLNSVICVTSWTG